MTRAGKAALRATRVEAAVPLLREAVELHRGLGNRPAELSATVLQADAISAPGDIPGAAELLFPAAERFADLDGTLEYLELTEALARTEMRLSHPDEAVEWCDRGLRSPAASDHARLALELLVTRGTVLGAGGRQIEAMATLRGALALAEEYGLPEVQARGLIDIGFVAGSDDPRALYAASREGLELVLRIGMPLYLPYLVGNCADGALLLGEWDAFERLVAPALELDLGPEIATHVAGPLAQIHGRRGEPYQDLIDQLAAHHSPDDLQHVAGLENALGDLALAAGRYAEAAERGLRSLATMAQVVTPGSQLVVGRAGLWAGDASLVRKALEGFGTRRGRMVDVASRELQAGLAALEGRTEDAAALYAEALREHDALGMAFERAVCQIGMVAVLPMSAHRSTVAEQARATLADLRAAPYLERLEEALARADGAAPPRSRSEARETASRPR